MEGAEGLPAVGCRGEVSRNKRFTEVGCVITHRARMWDPEGVCVGVNAKCRLTVVGLLSCHGNLLLSNSSGTHPQHHYALPDPRDTYQVLKSLALSLGGEFRRHGDYFSIPDDYGPEMGKTHHQQLNS